MKDLSSKRRLLMSQSAQLCIVGLRPVSSGFAVPYEVYRCQQMSAEGNEMSRSQGPRVKYASEDTGSRAWLHSPQAAVRATGASGAAAVPAGSTTLVAPTVVSRSKAP